MVSTYCTYKIWYSRYHIIVPSTLFYLIFALGLILVCMQKRANFNIPPACFNQNKCSGRMGWFSWYLRRINIFSSELVKVWIRLVWSLGHPFCVLMTTLQPDILNWIPLEYGKQIVIVCCTNSRKYNLIFTRMTQFPQCDLEFKRIAFSSSSPL